jgi:outer membrane protein assembly factor BamD (BamD/ComL family)
MREEYAVYERKTSTALKKSIDDFERKYPQVPRKIFDVYLQSLIGRER